MIQHYNLLECFTRVILNYNHVQLNDLYMQQYVFVKHYAPGGNSLNMFFTAKITVKVTRSSTAMSLLYFKGYLVEFGVLIPYGSKVIAKV